MYSRYLEIIIFYSLPFDTNYIRKVKKLRSKLADLNTIPHFIESDTCSTVEERVMFDNIFSGEYFIYMSNIVMSELDE